MNTLEIFGFEDPEYTGFNPDEKEEPEHGDNMDSEE